MSKNKFIPDPISTEEWHSWWTGFFLWPSTKMPKSIEDMVEKEFWYYQWGRRFAVFYWIGCAYLIKEIFW